MRRANAARARLSTLAPLYHKYSHLGSRRMVANRKARRDDKFGRAFARRLELRSKKIDRISTSGTVDISVALRRCHGLSITDLKIESAGHARRAKTHKEVRAGRIRKGCNETTYLRIRRSLCSRTISKIRIFAAPPRLSPPSTAFGAIIAAR